MVGCSGKMAGEDSTRRHPGAWPGGGADCAFEAGLPLPLPFEIAEPGEAQCILADAAVILGAAEDSANAGDCGCGRGLADVKWLGTGAAG